MANSYHSATAYDGRMAIVSWPVHDGRVELLCHSIAYKVRHRVSSLRLIKPDMDIHQSINVAITFEQKTFEESPSHVSAMSLSSKPSSRGYTDLQRLVMSKHVAKSWEISPKHEQSRQRTRSNSFRTHNSHK